MCVRVRSRAESGLEDAGFFAPGEVAPAWSEAREVPAGEFARVDVPVDAACDFYQFVSREESDTLDVVAIPRTLVVMKDPASGMESVYLCLYVADAEFAAWCAGRPRSEWIDGKAKNGFTGIVLYTTLSGRIVAAGRYDYGRLEGSVFFGDYASNREGALIRFSDLLGITCIARGRAAQATRGVNDDNQIQEVIILGPKKEVDPFEGLDWEPNVRPILGDEDGCRGGGGGGGISGGSTTSPCEKLYTNDSEVVAILNDLNKDCMGATLLRTLKPYVTVVPRAISGSECKTTIEYSFEGDQIKHQKFTLKLGTVLKDIALFEELIHIYQYTGRMNGPEDRLNIEIEAKLGWYMYRDRVGNFDDLSKALGGKRGADAFYQLSKCYRAKDFGSAEFYEAYSAAASALQRGGAYSDGSKYMFDPNACNFPNLEKLMENC